jgi:hypothetical protein
VGNAIVDPSCSGNITINVNVQAVQSVSDPPTGNFYLECIGGACPVGTSAPLSFGTASVVSASAAGDWRSSASFTIPVGAVSGPTTLQIRIVFVPHLDQTFGYLSFSRPSPYRASQIGYEITVPGSPSCPQISLLPPAVSVETYVEAFLPVLDTGCTNDAEFPVIAYTVPVSDPPAGTFIFECTGDFCPGQFFLSDFNMIHGVSSPSPSFTVPVIDLTPSDLFIEVTFIPDDPNQLPTRTSYGQKVGSSLGCPTTDPVSNGPPPTP